MGHENSSEAEHYIHSNATGSSLCGDDVWSMFMTVFPAAMVTALATGLGAVPFLWFRQLSPSLLARCNLIAAGFMLGASYALVNEALEFGAHFTGYGLLAGFFFVLITLQVCGEHDNLTIGNIKGVGATRAVIILAVMTLHSAAEGIGLGVSYAGSNHLGFFISAAIAVHNIPEGLAVSLVLVPRGSSVWSAACWSVVTSLPQPLLAVPAFIFIKFFSKFLPFGLGLAAGAMICVAVMELIPESRFHVSKLQIVVYVSVSCALMILCQEFLLHVAGNTPVPVLSSDDLSTRGLSLTPEYSITSSSSISVSSKL